MASGELEVDDEVEKRKNEVIIELESENNGFKRNDDKYF